MNSHGSDLPPPRAIPNFLLACTCLQQKATGCQPCPRGIGECEPLEVCVQAPENWPSLPS